MTINERGEIFMPFESILNQPGKAANQPESVFTFLDAQLRVGHTVNLDFQNTNVMSPSFAYIAFGKLYDKYGESVLELIKISNDKMNLKERIQQALNRRAEVLKYERA